MADPYRAAEHRPRPRFRVVPVPQHNDHPHGAPEVDRLIDSLQFDERIVSVYPVYHVGHNAMTPLLEALVEVTEGYWSCNLGGRYKLTSGSL